MKKTFFSAVKNGAAIMALLACGSAASAANPAIGVGNPYLPLWEHLPDGEPRVFEDPDNPGKYRAYIIGSHDLRLKEYCGPDIRMWSAPVEDLTKWTDEGPIFTFFDGKRWDVMFAPDLVEVVKKDGTKEYYLYPHCRGEGRQAVVCKGSRPDGPFTPVNLDPATKHATRESILGFDPSVFVDYITNPSDPDFATGYRAYGYWGFQRSSAAELDPTTMYSGRPGVEPIMRFIPTGRRGARIEAPKEGEYNALCEGQDPNDFNFFEASSIRQIGNKYIMIFSGYSGKEYGLGDSNSTLRYAYGDSPLGPWRSGGVLVDSRGVVLSEMGDQLITTNAAHNTHGSLQKINEQWYVFYHRPPRGFGFARQPMVAPVKITYDEKSVADGGKVTITGYDPYAADESRTATAANGTCYPGAEVTSEGFQLYGMDPYKYYSAGYACFMTNNQAMQDAWDIWDNHMDVNMKGGDIVGFKYFGFGGLKVHSKGLNPFEGTRPGNNTQLNVFLAPTTDKAFTIDIMLDGPWNNSTWNGKKIGQITVPAGSANKVAKYVVNVADAVDNLDKKHAIYLVANGGNADQVCTLKGLGFSKKGEKMDFPEVPTLTVTIDGKAIELPKHPVRSTDENGLTGYDQYATGATVAAGAKANVKATCPNKAVKIKVEQPKSLPGDAIITADYNGAVKTYTINIAAK